MNIEHRKDSNKVHGDAATAEIQKISVYKRKKGKEKGEKSKSGGTRNFPTIPFISCLGISLLMNSVHDNVCHAAN